MVELIELEKRITALETRLDNKKENLQEVHDDFYHLRDKLETITNSVVELTTLMKQAQSKEEDTDERVALLQNDLMMITTKIEKTNATLDTLKWLTPVACSVLTLILNYLL